jgi:hypothetical protein
MTKKNRRHSLKPVFVKISKSEREIAEKVLKQNVSWHLLTDSAATINQMSLCLMTFGQNVKYMVGLKGGWNSGA